MKIKLPQTYAVLIPSKGRGRELYQTLKAQPFLNQPTTFIGLERRELDDPFYRRVRKQFNQITYVTYHNPYHSGTLAREQLRRAAVRIGFQRYILTDDNTRFTKQSLANLVRASFVYPIQPCIVAGTHGTAEYFDAGRIKRTLETHDGLRFYKKRSAMFWAIPHSLYSKMKYEIDEGCMDDVQVSFAAFDRRILAQVVCIDAPFSKTRYKPGGYGSKISERVRKVGIAIQRFARTHPDYMAKVRVTFPWTQIEKNLEEYNED